MAERALRGTRLGATSYENDRNTDLAPRQEVAFDCPKGHRFTVPFSAEAEIPVNWECRVCGSLALTATGDVPAPKKAKPNTWTHVAGTYGLSGLLSSGDSAARISTRRAGTPASVRAHNGHNGP